MIIIILKIILSVVCIFSTIILAFGLMLARSEGGFIEGVKAAFFIMFGVIVIIISFIVVVCLFFLFCFVLAAIPYFIMTL